MNTDGSHRVGAIEHDVVATNSIYQCCFCGKTIESVPPDPAVLTYTTCADGPPQLQNHQTNWCHTRCLRANLHPCAKLYAVDCMELALEEQHASAAVDEATEE